MLKKKERQSGKEINAGGGAPHCSHHCSGISLLDSNGQALLQVGERLGFPGDLFEMATRSLKNKKVSGPKGPAVSMATGVKIWHKAIVIYI